MSDDPNGPATPVVEARKRARISAVWLVPIVAVLIALAIAYQSYQDRGELISITFPDASGVTAGTTTLRYREVVVGVVEDVGFTSDLSEVNVYIRVNNAIAPYLDESASFWIIQPEVTARGVEGLNTILSGTYVEGTWDNIEGEAISEFRGDERAPIVPPGVEGLPIVLRARDSSRLGSGAPILYRGIEVGEVAQPRLSPDGTEIRVDAFIRAPYDRRLSTATRFWDASGVSANLGPGGVELRIGSIASILEGGVNFDTLISGGAAIEPGHVFDIFDDEDSARSASFETPSSRSVRFGALFPSAISGLTTGAAIRFQGVRVGTVTAITGFIRPDDSTNQVQLLAVLALQPERMGFEGLRNDLEGVDFVNQLVLAGVRAKLTATSILGGELSVDLVEVPDAAPDVGLEIGVAANPLIPTVETEAQGLTASAESVLERINELPVEELLAAATGFLDNLNRIAGDEDTRAIPSEVLALLGDGRGLVRDGRAILSSAETAGVLADVASITEDLRQVAGDIAERQVASALTDTLAAATAAARSISAETRDVDVLVGSTITVLEGLAGVLEDPATAALPGLARETLDGASRLANAPELAAILADASAATADVRALVEPFDGAAIAATVASALDSVDAAAAGVAAGTADLGTLRTEVEGAVAAARGLLASEDTQALPAIVRSTLSGAERLLAAPELATILADAAAATAEIRAIVEPFDGGALAATVARALDAIDATAANVAAGTAELDTLRAQIDGVVGAAETLLASADTQALPGEARTLLSEAGDVIASPEVRTILTELSVVTADIRTITSQLAAEEAALRLTTALDAAAEAATAVAAGTANLPSLSATAERVLAEAEVLGGNLNALAQKANALALDELVNATTSLMSTADAFLSSDDADDVPVALVATLEELRQTIAAIRTGGTLDTLNATLSSASGAAEGVRVASAELPGLVARLSTLATQAGGVLVAYGDESRVNRELYAALRAATRAAEDVSSLSRTIERNPNSLLLGR